MNAYATRIGTLAWVVAVGAGLAASCQSSGATGGLNEQCTSTGSGLLSPLVCNTDLSCNEARHPAICEEPNTNGVGGPCSGDINCQISLWCDGTKSQCSEPIPLGAMCIVLSSCGLSAACSNTGDAGDRVCVPAGAEGEPCAGAAQTCATGLTCTKVDPEGTAICLSGDASVIVAPLEGGSGDGAPGGSTADATVGDAGAVDGAVLDAGASDAD